MRWVRDETGRLPLRPHFRPDEIDAECERLVGAFRREGRGPGGADASPLSTDDLTVLLEQVTDDLDLYADLSAEGQDTEGVTDFFPGQRPRVRIAVRLSESRRREHRLRTTLAHELGHVRLHDCLWTLDPRAPAPLNPRCRREGIEQPAGDGLAGVAGRLRLRGPADAGRNRLPPCGRPPAAHRPAPPAAGQRHAGGDPGAPRGAGVRRLPPRRPHPAVQAGAPHRLCRVPRSISAPVPPGAPARTGARLQYGRR